MLTPPALTVALLAELLGLERVHVFWVYIHLIHFIKSMGFSCSCRMTEVASISGRFTVVVGEVGVLLLKLTFQC